MKIIHYFFISEIALKKQEVAGIWHNISGECIQLDSELFPEVKWEDDEPTKVEMNFKIIRKNK